MERPAVPAPEALTFRARRRTRWSDEDNQGVLNHAVVLTLLEEARHAFFSGKGLLEENRFPFLLAQANVVFLSPGRGGVEVEVELATTHVGETSFTQAYRVRDVETGRVIAEAEARLVCYDPATGAKRPMSGSFRQALRA